MEKGKQYEAFVKAYNNFDVRPLSGKQLQEFYVDDFTKECTQTIADVIEMTERFRKILIVGQRGCGKSTILHKVEENLRDTYHVVFYEEETEKRLNIRELDVEPVDILLAIYLQVLQSAEKLPKTKNLPNLLLESFKKLMAFLGNVEISTEIISFKLRSEKESREAIRHGLHKDMRQLQENLSAACQEIRKATDKEVLVIFDGLDKLASDVATQVFFRDYQTLNDPQVKIVYTFPLHAYYHNDFDTISRGYTTQPISSITLTTQKGQEIEVLQKSLRKVVLKRIDASLVETEALDYLIRMSGGVLRDLIKFMQDTCFLAKREEKITRAIAEKAVNNLLREFNRLFDFPKYTQDVTAIVQTKQRDAVSNDALIYLLHYLFVLEYQHDQTQWFDIHPVLHQLLQKLGKING